MSSVSRLRTRSAREQAPAQERFELIAVGDVAERPGRRRFADGVEQPGRFDAVDDVGVGSAAHRQVEHRGPAPAVALGGRHLQGDGAGRTSIARGREQVGRLRWRDERHEVAPDRIDPVTQLVGDHLSQQAVVDRVPVAVDHDVDHPLQVDGAPAEPVDRLVQRIGQIDLVAAQRRQPGADRR
jgi:hypothetical protein